MWAYSSFHATKLDNLLIQPDTPLRPCDMYYGKTPAWAEHLHSFGEMEVVKSTTQIESKLDNKGFPDIYFGPSGHHKGYNYIFCGPLPKQSIESSSAVFLQKTMETSIKWINQNSIKFAAITDELS
jgi:hypothetical protein